MKKGWVAVAGVAAMGLVFVVFENWGSWNETVEAKKEPEVAQGEIGSYQTPAKIGETVTVDELMYDMELKTWGTKVDITLETLTRGQDAAEEVADWGLQQKRDDGLEYAVGTVHVNVHSADSIIEMYHFTAKSFSAESETGTVYPSPLVSGKEIAEATIFNNEEATGKVVFVVEAGEPFTLVYTTNKNKQVYFKQE